jgi:hypothetical protein
MESGGIFQPIEALTWARKNPSASSRGFESFADTFP